MTQDFLSASDAPSWRKSSYSNGTGGNCVEVATNHPTHTPIRDSKDPHGPALTFPAPALTAFLTALRTSTLN
ncbi:DUF397 domain-containing protein [Kitasatospora acidiphila]|uniref:DUF397 domain-containing protein n=1 Tax=Kitasatospora acidiphila TaxID=2567942 RepID=A0A540W1W5_9ACTN|nr:DUF397 domain-containing protein [Kitasatospora acidiphila]TQF02993.1 DUF397 domain-containing protein [Kitasatospora acidiphila]